MEEIPKIRVAVGSEIEESSGSVTIVLGEISAVEKPAAVYGFSVV